MFNSEFEIIKNTARSRESVTLHTDTIIIIINIIWIIWLLYSRDVFRSRSCSHEGQVTNDPAQSSIQPEPLDSGEWTFHIHSDNNESGPRVLMRQEVWTQTLLSWKTTWSPRLSQS